jgi:uncharacterized protein YqjF (DUF2071 family)
LYECFSGKKAGKVSWKEVKKQQQQKVAAQHNTINNNIVSASTNGSKVNEQNTLQGNSVNNKTVGAACPW